MTTQQRNAIARRETQKELSAAIAMRAERGTVVTSTGAWVAFTVEYLTFTSDKQATRITVKGTSCWSIADAASAALYEWGYTR